MHHTIIERDRAGEPREAPIRRAWTAWIALGVIGIAAGCDGETKEPSSTGAGTTGTGAGTGGGGGGGGGGGTTLQCSIGARDLLVSEGVGTSPAVAFAADHYLVAWTSTVKDAGDIRVALLDAKGTKVSEQALAEGPGQSGFPSVVPSAGGGFLVIWQDTVPPGSAIRGRRVDALGMPKGAAFTIAQSASVDARPSAVPAAGGAALAWSDGPGVTLGQLTDDMLVSKTPLDLAFNPSLGGLGANLGITWIAGTKIGASVLPGPNVPLLPVLFRNAPGKPNAPRVAVHEDGALSVAWEDNRGGDGNETIYLTRIDKSGKASSERLIPMTAESANYPDVAWTGSHDAVVYYQFRGGPPAIYLSLVTKNLTASGQDLKISGDGLSVRYPRVARTGDPVGTIGIVYVEKDGPIRASLVSCP